MSFQKDKRANRQRPQDDLRTLIRQARTVAEGLDRDRFNARPGPGRWSVGECLDHLNATARLYLPVLTDAIHRAREKGLAGRGGSGTTWIGRVLVWTQEPPPRRATRMGTWPELEPTRDLDPAETLDAFEALHEELIVRMNEASDLDRKRVKVRSALDSRLRLSLGDWFAFLAAHGRRHLWQADRALKDLD